MKEQVEREIELRRHRKTLTVLGAGIIAFGFWNLMKTFMMDLEDQAALLHESDPEGGMRIAVVMIGGVTLFIIADLLLRIVVGLTSIRTGRGTARKRLRLWGFIVLVVLGGLATFVDVVILVFALLFHGGNTEILIKIPDIIVTLLGDLTGFLIMVQLLIAAVHVRKLMKEQYAD